MNITDPLEKIVAGALDYAGIRYLHESADKSTCCGLDFYLPGHATFIEVTAYHTPRKIEQMRRARNIILIQGAAAAETFALMLRRGP